MTDKEKQILIKFFLTFLKLSRSKKPTTAKEYATQMTNLISELFEEKQNTKDFLQETKDSIAKGARRSDTRFKL